MEKQFSGNEESYKLSLSDGTRCSFSAVRELNDWMNILKDMMCLRKCEAGEECAIKYFFVVKKSSNQPPVLPNQTYSHKNILSGLYANIWHHPKVAEVFVELNLDLLTDHGMDITNMFQSMKILNNYIVNKGGTPFHTAFAGLNNKGILITAQGNTGKSTSLSRLPDYWEKICDDLVLVLKNTAGQFRVHPLPTWNDYIIRNLKSTVDAEYSLPLKGIFFLEQAKNDEVIRIDPPQASVYIFDSLNSNSERLLYEASGDKNRTMNIQLMDIAVELAKSIPCYRLKATLTGRFWEEIEKKISPAC